MNRANIVLIGAGVAGIGLGAAIGHNDPALGQTALSGIVQTLKAPFALLAARSPGERGKGALLPTKPGHGPHERVLSTVRDREPVAGAPFAEDAPFAGVPESLVMAPQDITPNGMPGPFSQNGPFNAFPGNAFPGNAFPGNAFPLGQFPFGPFGFASFPIGSATPVMPVGDEVADTTPVLETNPPEIVPNNPPTDGTPRTDAPPQETPPTVIPEPASWSVTLLGLLAIAALVRRRPRRFSGPS